MKSGKTILTIIGVVALLVSFTSQANAEIIDETAEDIFTLTIDDHSGHGPVELKPKGNFDNVHRKFQFQNTGKAHKVPGRFSIEWVVNADPDPFLHQVFTFTNNYSTTKNFTLTATLEPISPAITGQSLTGGSVSLTVIDSGGGTAELSSITGVPIYMSLLDNVPHQSLLDPSQSFVTGNYGTTASGIVPEEFGTPIPSLIGPPVLSSIGIELNARLTSGDTATIVATLVVTPEPGTVTLLAIGGVTMLLRRRRRHA